MFLRQLGVERDFGAAEDLGDRAVLLGRFGDLLELGVVDAGNRGGRRQVNLGDAEAGFFFAQIDLGLGLDALGRRVGLGEAPERAIE